MLRHFVRRFSTNPFAKKLPLPDIHRIIITASCKGGVGKSTIALNTAISLSELGFRVGLFDADFYGPSIPTMTSTTENRIQQTQESSYLTVPAYGIDTISLGHGIDAGSALLWKGPLIAKFIDDLLKKTLWPPLDYLIVDTPPGTGDIPLALYQSVKIDGALLVTSPQTVSMIDVSRSIDMFNKMQIPIVGIVQNLDGYVCPCCKKVTRVFPGKSAQELAKKFDLEVLGSLAIDPAISQAADDGFPAVLKNPNSSFTQAMRTVARRVMLKVPLPKEGEETKQA
jgi:ATP-binding protein involved in chromosome partitioning